MHEDGLADTADGFGGGHTREEKLAIMRDSRQGSYGIIALIVTIGLRAVALTAIGDPIEAALALIAAHAASRAALPPALYLMHPAREDGLGATAGRPTLTATLVAVAIGALIALGVLGPVRGVVALVVMAAAVGGIGDACAAPDRRLHRRRPWRIPTSRRDRHAAGGGGAMSGPQNQVSPFNPGAVGAGDAGRRRSRHALLVGASRAGRA